MENHDGAITMFNHTARHPLGDRLAGLPDLPVANHHVAIDNSWDVEFEIAVAQRADATENARIKRAGAEWAPEPRPGIHAGRLDDRIVGCMDVLEESLVGKQGKSSMVEGVIPDQVPGRSDSAGQIWIRLHPSALHEKGGFY